MQHLKEYNPAVHKYILEWMSRNGKTAATFDAVDAQNVLDEIKSLPSDHLISRFLKGVQEEADLAGRIGSNLGKDAVKAFDRHLDAKRLGESGLEAARQAHTKSQERLAAKQADLNNRVKIGKSSPKKLLELRTQVSAIENIVQQNAERVAQQEAIVKAAMDGIAALSQQADAAATRVAAALNAASDTAKPHASTKATDALRRTVAPPPNAGAGIVDEATDAGKALTKASWVRRVPLPAALRILQIWSFSQQLKEDGIAYTVCDAATDVVPFFWAVKLTMRIMIGEENYQKLIHATPEERQQIFANGWRHIETSGVMIDNLHFDGQKGGSPELRRSLLGPQHFILADGHVAYLGEGAVQDHDNNEETPLQEGQVIAIDVFRREDGTPVRGHALVTVRWEDNSVTTTRMEKRTLTPEELQTRR